MPHIVLTGFKSCGKTTVGRALAARMGARFVDLDSALQDVYFERTGRRAHFREIFRDEGPEAFRALEREAAERVAAHAASASRPLIVALGGGALCIEATRRAVARIGPIVYLQAPFAEILDRVRREGFPAYVRGEDKEAAFEAVFEERRPLYESCADILVDVAGATPDEAAERIEAALDERESNNGR